MLSSKKCPHCGAWSAWQQLPDDRCFQCGELLNPQAYAEAQQAATRAQEPASAPLRFQVNPADSAATRLGKRLVYSGQVLFAALLSALMALIASLAL